MRTKLAFLFVIAIAPAATFGQGIQDILRQVERLISPEHNKPQRPLMQRDKIAHIRIAGAIIETPQAMPVVFFGTEQPLSPKALLERLRPARQCRAGTAVMTRRAGDRGAPYFGALVVVALRVALPVMGALLLTDLILGLVGRTVPQMNVLVVGFPVKVGVGILALAASLPLATALIGTVLRETLLDVNGFLVP